MVIDLLKEKKTLPEARSGVTELTNVTVQNPSPASGILTWYPFAREPKLTYKELPNNLGPSHPWPIAVLMETFSTSAFKVLIWIIATTTKICTRRCSTRDHSQGFHTTPTPPYTLMHNFRINGRVSVTRWSAINFRG